MSVGLEVHEAGLVPTPALQFAVRTLGFAGGVMVTASHNPPAYNGVKVMGGDGVEIPPDHESAIEAIYYDRRFKETDWKGVGQAQEATRVGDPSLSGILRHCGADGPRGGAT